MPPALLLPLTLSLTLILSVVTGRAEGQELVVKPDATPQSILKEADNLARAGRFEEALQRQIWFRANALRLNPAMVGVRQSFALSAWVELGKKYPPAQQALVDARDQARAACLGKGGTNLDFSDAASINGYLDEDDQTVALFRQLDAEQPKLARTSIHYAKKQLVEAGEYGLCARYIPNPDQDFRSIRTGYEGIINNKELIQGNPGIKQAMEEMFTTNTCQLIEILVGAGRKPEAEAIQAKALAVRDVPEIRDAIPAAERRIGQHAPPTTTQDSIRRGP